MAYDVARLRDSVRSVIQNEVGQATFPNSDLDRVLLLGKRRLDENRPRTLYVTVPAGSRSYAVGSLNSWVEGFSTVHQIFSVDSNGYVTEVDDPQTYDVYPVNGVESLVFMSARGVPALAELSVPWQIDGLDGATTTTLVPKLYNALELVCAAFVVLALAIKVNGQIDQRIAADILGTSSINAIRYRDLHKELMARYGEEVDLSMGPTGQYMNPGVLERSAYPMRTQSGRTWLTHGGRGY